MDLLVAANAMGILADVRSQIPAKSHAEMECDARADSMETAIPDGDDKVLELQTLETLPALAARIATSGLVPELYGAVHEKLQELHRQKSHSHG